MTDKQDPITHAARLLREAAEELRQAHAYNNSEGWENETDAKAAYDEHMAAAQALEDWEAAVGAGGVQALSAAPAVPVGWKLVPVEPTNDMQKAADEWAAKGFDWPKAVYRAMLAASPTPPAEQQAPKAAPTRTALPEGWTDCTIEFGNDGPEVVAYGPKRMMTRLAKWLGKYFAQVIAEAAPKAAPGVGNSGFDHKTAADFLSGKTVSDEAVRKFVAASRWAHDERAALSATLLAMHGVLTSREAEIALLKKALLEAEAAPQPAPAPLSEMPYEKQKAIQEGEQIGASDAWFHARHEMLDTIDRRNVFRAGFDRGWNAALAAQEDTP